MTTTADAPNARPSRTAAGIVCVEAGMLMFVVQDGLMKALLGDFTVWTLIMARAVVTLIVVGPLIIFLGSPHRLLTPLWPLHVLRAALFAIGFSLFYTAFPFMGLAEVTTIFFSAPLLTALVATVFLGEKIGVHRAACLVIGFIGVLIAMNPTSDAFQWVAVLPLITAATYAVSQVIARQIGDRETTLTLGFYTVVLCGIFVVPIGFAVNQLIEIGPEFRHLRWDWTIPADGIPMLLLIGLNGMIGYMLISRAYQIADASVVAPFDYTYLPFAALMAYAIWDEIPGWNTVIGMVLIIGSGLYLGYREISQSRRRLDPTPTAEIAFNPGAPIGAIAHASDVVDRDDATTGSDEEAAIVVARRDHP